MLPHSQSADVVDASEDSRLLLESSPNIDPSKQQSSLLLTASKFGSDWSLLENSSRNMSVLVQRPVRKDATSICAIRTTDDIFHLCFSSDGIMRLLDQHCFCE